MLVAVAYFGLQGLAALILGDVLSVIREPGIAARALLALMLAATTAIALLQATGVDNRRLQNLRIHLARGLYINLYINRWLGAFRADSTRQGA